MMKPLLLLGIVISTTICYAQKIDGIVKGVVQDTSTGLMLAGASVSVSKNINDSLPITSSMTSEGGFFEMRLEGSGTYYLRISHGGYEPHTHSFVLTSDSVVANLDTLKLSKLYKSLSEVVVTDKTPIRVK